MSLYRVTLVVSVCECVVSSVCRLRTTCSPKLLYVFTLPFFSSFFSFIITNIATVKRLRSFPSFMQPICTHKIGVHSKKSPYTYPVIRLPREFRRLVGAVATVFETTHNGALAFLVVPHSRESESSARARLPKLSLYTAGIKRSNRFEPILLRFYEEYRLRLEEELI